MKFTPFKYGVVTHLISSIDVSCGAITVRFGNTSAFWKVLSCLFLVSPSPHPQATPDCVLFV